MQAGKSRDPRGIHDYLIESVAAAWRARGASLDTRQETNGHRAGSPEARHGCISAFHAGERRQVVGRIFDRRTAGFNGTPRALPGLLTIPPLSRLITYRANGSSTDQRDHLPPQPARDRNRLSTQRSRCISRDATRESSTSPFAVERSLANNM